MIKITDSIAIYDTPDYLEVTGRELTASDIIPAIGARKTVCIIADKLHLNGIISVPQGNVTVVSRHIIGSDGSRIDVSGINGRDAPETPVHKPIDTAITPNGMDGPDIGGSAGSIVVVAQRFEGDCALCANGGRGSMGQPGGDAANGAPGWPSDENGKPGGNGGAAGPIGRAGKSRNSGNGGSISTFIGSGGDLLTTSVVGGPQIPAASHGKAGKPGAGGVGGRDQDCDFIDRGPRSAGPDIEVTRYGKICWWIEERLPSGAAGAPSPAIAEAPTAGMKGQDGQVVKGEPALHGAQLPLRGLRWLLLEAEMLYIEATGAGMDAQEPMRASLEMAGFVLILTLGSGRPEILEVGARASALMHRITSGSPPEGTRGLEVPLLPLPELLETMRHTLESRWRATTYINSLKSDARDEREIQIAIQAVHGQANSIRSEGDARLRELTKRRGSVVETVDGLSNSYHLVWQEVLKADRAFQEEVRKKNPCAEFLDIAIVVGSVAVTVMTGGAAAASVVAAGGEVLAYLAKDEQRKKAYEAQIEEAGGLKTKLQGHAKTAQDFVGKVKELKELLGGDALTPPSDRVKFSMSREDFNKMVEPYKGMGAAEALKQQMDRFFSLTETRNSLLLEHDQIVVETASIRAQMEAAKKQVDELIGKDGAALIELTIEAYEAALWLDLEAGKRVMGVLQAANRAYEYLSLRPRMMNLRTTRGDNLESEYSRLLSESALILRPDQLAREAVCEVTISPRTHPETFAALASGSAVVSLMPEHVPEAQKDRWDERAFSLGIKINGLKRRPRDPVELRASMVSCGIAWFRDRDGNPVSMRTPMRDATDIPVSTALDLEEVRASRNLLGVDHETVSASPYGLWRLRIPGIQKHLPPLDEHLKKRDADQITLTFCFVGTARVSHKVGALLDYRYEDLKNLLSRPKSGLFDLKLSASQEAGLIETSSAVEDLHAVRQGSPMEGAIAVRLAEDMLYRPVKWKNGPRGTPDE